MKRLWLPLQGTNCFLVQSGKCRNIKYTFFIGNRWNYYFFIPCLSEMMVIQYFLIFFCFSRIQYSEKKLNIRCYAIVTILIFSPTFQRLNFFIEKIYHLNSNSNHKTNFLTVFEKSVRILYSLNIKLSDGLIKMWPDIICLNLWSKNFVIYSSKTPSLAV